jgi:Sulfotransferase family
MSPDTDLEAVERKLVWIMGSPRTGSTWLLRLLCHPWGVGRTPTGIDPSRFRPRGGNLIPVNESYLPHHLGPLRDPLPPPETAADTSLLLNDTRGSDPAYFFSEEYRDTWREPLRRMALERFDAQAQRAATEHGIVDPLILIKEPNGSHASDLVAGLFGQSRLIFLIRDGRDVVDSMMDADSDGGWRTRTEGVTPLKTEAERLSGVRRQAHLWLVRTLATQRACAILGPEHSIEVRYEELLSDTEGELARLDSWLGIGRDRRQIRSAVRTNRFGSLRNRLRGRRKGVRAASPGFWRENLSSSEQQAMIEIMGPKLRELGYQT